MGARAYDPATRGFLSTDPITAPAGAAWAANPYSYAGNDPLHATDPLGLQPVTDQQLTAYANAHQGALATAGNAIGEWWNENWEYVAGGAMVIAGGIVIATGVGGPVGAMLIGAGADTIIQKATTGDVNWGQVALSGAFGFVPGAGAASGLLVHAGVNAAEGAVENTAQYLISGQPITPGGLLSTAASGAAISTVTAGALSRVPASNTVARLGDELPTPSQGQRIFRVYGDDALPGGASWSPVDPRTVPNYREAAGLPSGGIDSDGAVNSGRFLLEGTLMDPDKVVRTRNALPLDGYGGGIPEYIIPQGLDNGAIRLDGVIGVNPEF